MPIKVKHDDETGFGFVLKMDGKKVGYTSDTEYYDGIGESYKGCDLLIVNNLKAEDDNVPGHLYTKTTVQLLCKAKPKLAVLSHIGMRLIKSGPDKEARKIGKLSGVKTICADDGMRIRI